MRFALLAAFSLCASTALAGTPPTEEPFTCPVGGEEFTITGTLSCSQMGGRTMLLKPVTSCDFVTLLPVCPDNGLPVYREFDEGEVEGGLEELIASEDWAAIRARPPWDRALALATWLEDPPEHQFGLALNGLWQDSAAVLADPTRLDRILAEFDTRLNDQPDEGILSVLAAYALLAAGREAEAEAWLDRARGLELDDWGGQAYLSTVEACRGGRMTSAACAPGASYPPLN